MTTFIDKLTAAIEQNNTLLCVGLDPAPDNYPSYFTGLDDEPTHALISWGKSIIDQTADLVCCYKPNYAFYEQFGLVGLMALQETISLVPPHIPVLLDAKRGDIGHSAMAYATAAFEVWGADALTVNPYLGRDGVTPFVSYGDKTVFLLCHTSNSSAAEVQEFGMPEPLFEHVTRIAQSWGSVSQIGFVVGATQPQALARVRALVPHHWILAPGVGAQGGNLAHAVSAGLDSTGRGLIVPVSRSILYADDPRATAMQLRDEINGAREGASLPPAQPAPGIDPELSRQMIAQLHEVGCIQFGEFTLASGQTSPIYIDLRRVVSSPVLLKMVAQTYTALLHPLTFDHLAAVPYAALPLGTATALTMNKSLIYPRKESKSYGTGKTIEGHFTAGDKAVIIEDLVTSGGSVLKVIEQLQAAGLTVRDVVVLIDREQGGPENLSAQGYHLHAACTLSMVLQTLHQLGRISMDQLTNVQNYLRA